MVYLVNILFRYFLYKKTVTEISFQVLNAIRIYRYEKVCIVLECIQNVL